MEINLIVTLTRTDGPAIDDFDQLGDELVGVIESYNIDGKLHIDGDEGTEGTTYDLSATYDIIDEEDNDPVKP